MRSWKLPKAGTYIGQRIADLTAQNTAISVAVGGQVCLYRYAPVTQENSLVSIAAKRYLLIVTAAVWLLWQW